MHDVARLRTPKIEPRGSGPKWIVLVPPKTWDAPLGTREAERGLIGEIPHRIARLGWRYVASTAGNSFVGGITSTNPSYLAE
jgi:hypothetical protein